MSYSYLLTVLQILLGMAQYTMYYQLTIVCNWIQQMEILLFVIFMSTLNCSIRVLQARELNQGRINEITQANTIFRREVWWVISLEAIHQSYLLSVIYSEHLRLALSVNWVITSNSTKYSSEKSLWNRSLILEVLVTRLVKRLH